MSTYEEQMKKFLDSLKEYNLSKLIRHLHLSGAVTEEEARTLVRVKKDGALANLKVLLTTDRRGVIFTEVVKFVRNAANVFEATVQALQLSPITYPTPSSSYPSTSRESTAENVYAGPQVSAPYTQPQHTSNSDVSSDGSSTLSVASGMEVDHPEVNMSQEPFQEDNINHGALIPAYNPNASADSGVATQDPNTYSQQSQPTVNLQSLVVNNTNITIHLPPAEQHFRPVNPQNHLQTQEQQLSGSVPEGQDHYERSPTRHQDKVFQKCKSDFLKFVNVQALEPLLLSDGWLTRHESQQLGLLCHTEMDKNERLFQIIPTKAPNYLEQFVMVLRREDQHKGHQCLADILTKYYLGKEFKTSF